MGIQHTRVRPDILLNKLHHFVNLDFKLEQGIGSDIQSEERAVDDAVCYTTLLKRFRFGIEEIFHFSDLIVF